LRISEAEGGGGGDVGFKAVPTLDELAADPAKATQLTASERARAQLQCAAILAALATAPEKPKEQLLEPAEAALRMNVGRTTVYEMLRDGRLEFVLKGKRGKLIPESEIENWKTKNLREGVGLRQESLDARVADTESRRTIGNHQKTPPSIGKDGLAGRLQGRFG
jgi:excisionase family DNA binding protein